MYLLIFRKGKGGGERRETSICGCLSHAPCWDLACNLGMCPDWESNWRPFGSQAYSQSTELHQLGLLIFDLFNFLKDFISFQRGKGREKEGEKTLIFETLISCLLYVPQLGVCPC